MSTFSHQSQTINPFYVMSILEQAQKLQAQGVDVIHLEIGEPDFATPQGIVDAGIEALKQGQTKYTPALGLPALRQAIADDYRQRFNVDLDPKRVVVTPGASGALLLLAAARLDRDQQLMLADPGYPCNRNFAGLFAAHGQLIPCGPQQNYQLTPELIDQYWMASTKAALVASPANPTGSQCSLEELQALDFACRDHGGELWVDEIYQGLNFTQATTSILQSCPEAVVINSFSKFFGMTGWRLGWTVVPKDWVSVLDNLAQNIFLAASTPAQYAALAAYTPEVMTELQQRRLILQQRRDYLLQELPKLGFKIPIAPDGAFYIYLDASPLTEDATEFCQQLLAQTGVALTPGRDFGHYQAKTHIRIAYTTSYERLQEAVARIKQFLAR